ncbi:hypothetical protein HDU67_007853 [Dinochytrium kinnereticum]|nr:hypothetical protein HDU67_007853 [Dinochytrium kinnereticum]
MSRTDNPSNDSSTPGSIKRGRGVFKAPITPHRVPIDQPSKKERQMMRVYPIDSRPKPAVEDADVSRKSAEVSKPPSPPASASLCAPGSPPRPQVEGDEDVAKLFGEMSVKEGDGVEAEEDEEGDWEKLAENDQVHAVQVATEPVLKPKSVSRVPVSYEDLDVPTTVLECFDFPPSARTSDLHDVFQDFQGVSGPIYRIHWLTDTSALIVFPSAGQAKSAYAKTLSNPFVKNPKVQDQSQQVLPPTPTSPPLKKKTPDKVARRLIAGALGMRVKKKTAEEEEADLKKIKEAQDAKEAEKLVKIQREQGIERAWSE